MTTFTETTVAGVQSRLGTVSAGDIIEVTAGVKAETALTFTTTKNWSANPVIIRPVDRDNPCIWRRGWTVSNINGLTLDGMIWEGNVSNDTAPNGSGWPNTGGTQAAYALRFTSMTNLTVTNCRIRGTAETATQHPGFKQGIYCVACADVEISYNEIRDVGQDFLDLWDTITRCHVHHNRFGPDRIDNSRAGNTGRHPDVIQGAVTGDAANKTNHWTDVTIEDNYITTVASRCQAFYCHMENNPTQAQTTRHSQNTIIRRNFINTGHYYGIHVTGHVNFEFTGNLIRRNATNAGGPGFSFGAWFTGEMTNNVTPRQHGNTGGQLTLPSDFATRVDQTTTQFSTTAFPTGWNTNLINEVGPYATGAPEPPPIVVLPDQLEAGEWSIGEVVASPTQSGEYTGIIHFPTGSPAATANGFRWSKDERWVQNVAAASTATVTLGTLANGSTIDGVALVTGDRVLLKNQTAATTNGIYDIGAAGPATRSSDADAGGEFAGLRVYVVGGTTNGAKAFASSGTVSLGSTNIVFTEHTQVGPEIGVLLPPVGTTRRWRMDDLNPGSGNHSVAANTLMDGIRVYHRPDSSSPLSLYSADEKSFTFVPQQGPTVTSVTLNAASYTAGQTATATVAYTLGTGTLTSIAYQWKADGVNVGTNSASYATVAPSGGSDTLTCTVTVTSSVSAHSLISANSTVVAIPVSPTVTSVALNQASYISGNTATATATFTTGSGTLTSTTYQWYMNGVLSGTGSTFAIPTTGTLFCRFTIVTSVNSATLDSSTVNVGAPAPTAPAAGSWGFVAVREVSTGLFAGQLRFPVGSAVNQSAVIAVQWTPDSGVNWYNTTEPGLHTDGRRLFELTSPTTTHLVGYSTTSSTIRIRISTNSGTSSISGLGSPSTYTGNQAPPPPVTELTALTDGQWEFISPTVTAPGLTNRFTAYIRAVPPYNDNAWTGVQWVDSTGVWGETVLVQTDGDGQFNWRMMPKTNGGSDHAVQYEKVSDLISLRYITADGISAQSLASETFTGPDTPEPDFDPGICYDVGGSRITVGGVRLTYPVANRPSNITGSILVTTEDDTVTVLAPELPPDAVGFIVNYNGIPYTQTDSLFSFPYAVVTPKNQGTLKAFNAAGDCSISRYFNVTGPTLIWDATESLAALAADPAGMITSTANGEQDWRVEDTWQDPDEGYLDFVGDQYNIHPAQDPDYPVFETASGAAIRMNMFRLDATMGARVLARTGDASVEWGTAYLISNETAGRYFRAPFYIEWEMKSSDRAQGHGGALWMYATSATSAPKGAYEIDLLELAGFLNSDWWFTSLHQRNEAQAGTDYGAITQVNQDVLSYHRYAVEHTGQAMRFYRDEVALDIDMTGMAGTGTLELTGAVSDAFEGVDFTLRMGIGTGLAEGTDGSTPDEMYMDIKTLKVWRLNPYE